MHYLHNKLLASTISVATHGLAGCKFSMAILFICGLSCAGNCRLQAERFEPTSSFTARFDGAANVIAGGVDPVEREGTVWKSRFLFIQENTADRSVIEFDLRGRSRDELVTLDFRLTDRNGFTDNISLYSFEANGLANAADFFRTDNLITTFTGISGEYSFDITTSFNDAIDNDSDYLGLIFRNTTGPRSASFSLGNGSDQIPLPSLTTTGVPEPSSLYLGSMLGCLILARRRSSNR